MFAQLISVKDLRLGDLIAHKVNERTLEVIGEPVKVEELTISRRALYAFVNRRYRYDVAAGSVYRVVR